MPTINVQRLREVDGDSTIRCECGETRDGLREDVDYLITCQGPPAVAVIVDDVSLVSDGHGRYPWRPSFYAGRVCVEVRHAGSNRTSRFWLEVDPAASKSDRSCFDEMVIAIRAVDPALLGGTSAATLGFGRAGQAGPFDSDIALHRLRSHGGAFLSSLEAVSRAPHQALRAEHKRLPLSRIRRLHPAALRDPRVLAMARAVAEPESAVSGSEDDEIQAITLQATATFDTPANRALTALLRRFAVAAYRLQSSVRELRLGGSPEDQQLRAPLRLQELADLQQRAGKLLLRAPFSEAGTAQLSAAGLTQVAAQPAYSLAYRLGTLALSLGMNGEAVDRLHVSPSWGIYETWCYHEVLRLLSQSLGQAARPMTPKAVAADLSHGFDLSSNTQLQLYFQATFPAGKPHSERIGWSVSRERRPDILLVLERNGESRAMILDAKWRSGRPNILEAMESAHIYHDALRIQGARPDACMLLLPGVCDDVGWLTRREFIDMHRVGGVKLFRPGDSGASELAELIQGWIAESLRA